MPSSVSISPTPSVILQPLPFTSATLKGNDPAQYVSTSNGRMTITGNASNDGVTRSFVELTLGSKKVKLSVNQGETPRHVMMRLANSLPEGFRLEGTVKRSGEASFRIMRTFAWSSQAKEVDQVFENAKKPSSESGTKVSAGELNRAVKAAMADGFLVAGERDALAKNYAMLFTGAGYHATAAAQRKYQALTELYAMPTYPVR